MSYYNSFLTSIMTPQLVRLAALIALLGFIGDVSAGQRVEALIAELAEQMDLTLNKMSKTIDQLSRQLMLQQLFVEERIRSDGGSGLKQSRQSTQGRLFRENLSKFPHTNHKRSSVRSHTLAPTSICHIASAGAY